MLKSLRTTHDATVLLLPAWDEVWQASVDMPSGLTYSGVSSKFSVLSPHRLARPRTPGFHPGNTGSNPVGVAIFFRIREIGVCLPKLDLLTRLLPPPDAACTACEAEIPATHYRLNRAVAVSEMR